MPELTVAVTPKRRPRDEVDAVVDARSRLTFLDPAPRARAARSTPGWG